MYAMTTNMPTCATKLPIAITKGICPTAKMIAITVAIKVPTIIHLMKDGSEEILPAFSSTVN